MIVQIVLLTQAKWCEFAFRVIIQFANFFESSSSNQGVKQVCIRGSIASTKPVYLLHNILHSHFLQIIYTQFKSSVHFGTFSPSLCFLCFFPVPASLFIIFGYQSFSSFKHSCVAGVHMTTNGKKVSTGERQTERSLTKESKQETKNLIGEIHFQRKSWSLTKY